MESPDSVFMESPKTNGSTTAVGIPPSANGVPTQPYPKKVMHSSPSRSSSFSSVEPPNKKSAEETTCRQCFCDNLLTIATLVGVIIGVALGIGLRNAKAWSKREIMYVNYIGELFLNMLKCLILPLIVSSLVAAVGSLDTRLSGRIGLRAVAYYMITTVMAIILGIILVVAIQPGKGDPTNIEDDAKIDRAPSLPEDTLMDLVRNMFPPNIMQATMRQFMTALVVPPDANVTNDTELMKTWDFKEKWIDQTNILGVVVFSIVLGVTLAHMREKGKPLLDVFITLSDAIMIITKGVIWLSPVGILFLVASKILEMKDMAVVAGQIGLYTVTVFTGIMCHGFIVLPLIYLAFTRKNPFRFIINMGQALATAFGTASSSATLPITIACLEEKNCVDPRVARFVLPIGATINMDGTALYEAVAAIFIAQVRQVPLSLGNLIAISITSTAASIGAAGIPQAGLVTMVMVLNVVGLPAEDVALILIVDWILDRFRTLINVLGDGFGSAIVAHFSEKDLAEITEEDNANLETTPL